MDSPKKYQPISCTFYDYIEHYAMRKELIRILLKNDMGGHEQFHSRILDTKTQDRVEYFLLEATTEWIRMDRIISLNEHRLSDYQNC